MCLHCLHSRTGYFPISNFNDFSSNIQCSLQALLWWSVWGKQLLQLFGWHHRSSMFVIFFCSYLFLFELMSTIMFHWCGNGWNFCSIWNNECLWIMTSNKSLKQSGYQKKTKQKLNFNFGQIEHLGNTQQKNKRHQGEERKSGGVAARCGWAELLFPSASSALIEKQPTVKVVRLQKQWAAGQCTPAVPRRVPSSIKCTGAACCFMSYGQRSFTSSVTSSVLSANGNPDCKVKMWVIHFPSDFSATDPSGKLLLNGLPLSTMCTRRNCPFMPGDRKL